MSLDILKAEIQRKRKQLEKTELVETDRKFFRRGDLNAKEEAEYWKKYNEKHGREASSSSVNTIASGQALQLLESTHIALSREEVIRGLRERGEPIRLFGESDELSLMRLRKLEIEAPELNIGWKNDLQDAMTKVDNEYLEEVLHKQTVEGKHDVKIEEDGVTLKEIEEDATELAKADTTKQCEVILKFLNFLLQKWGKELNARTEEEKRSGRGKMASATFTQTADYLTYLLKKLKNESIQQDIREHLVSITHYMLRRDYIQANNAYMEMAIGNAPWPVGVTASGIHKRPGNEKFYVKNVAHVLNDETQRKYIQALKRLMTKCQYYFPTDPSKCVEYGAFAIEHGTAASTSRPHSPV